MTTEIMFIRQLLAARHNNEYILGHMTLAPPTLITHKTSSPIVSLTVSSAGKLVNVANVTIACEYVICNKTVASLAHCY